MSIRIVKKSRSITRRLLIAPIFVALIIPLSGTEDSRGESRKWLTINRLYSENMVGWLWNLEKFEVDDFYKIYSTEQVLMVKSEQQEDSSVRSSSSTSQKYLNYIY